ncbi:hypothetical protein [Halarcobacter sp.]|uniref:hypothetical protein n=1 Tax=Halarcobacter sp. TaxID=2321133 RepID=UPI002AA69BE2|nr:hypothetical protein [Halarcobacter sp.]
MNINQAIMLLKGTDKLEPMNHKTKSLKGFQLRTILLLIVIAQKEGENQAYFKENLNWTFNSVSTHTRTLIEYGFIVQGDDERDPRYQSKRLYLAPKVRKVLEEQLSLEIN